MGAVLGLTQLKKIDKFIDIRRKNYDEFYNIIKPHTDKFIPLHYSLGNSSFCFPIISRTPEIKTRLIGELKNADIEFRPIVAGNLLKQPYLKSFKSQKCPHADLLHANGLYVGNNQFVKSKDLKKLKEILQKT